MPKRIGRRWHPRVAAWKTAYWLEENLPSLACLLVATLPAAGCVFGFMALPVEGRVLAIAAEVLAGLPVTWRLEWDITHDLFYDLVWAPPGRRIRNYYVRRIARLTLYLVLLPEIIAQLIVTVIIGWLHEGGKSCLRRLRRQAAKT